MMKGPEYRRAQLVALIDALGYFIPLAEKQSPQLDPLIPQFDYCLRFAKHLYEVGFGQDDLDELSRNVTEIFNRNAKGCFDFFPAVEAAAYGKWEREVHERAYDLRLRETKHSNES